MDRSTRAMIQTLLDGIKTETFTDPSRATNEQAAGLLLSKFFQFDGVSILRAAEAGLEDSNFHTDAGVVAGLAEAYDHARDDEPYDDDMRKALFARLGEVYGRSLTRTERLAKLSTIVERPILTMSVRTSRPLTRGEFARAMRVLDTLAR